MRNRTRLFLLKAGFLLLGLGSFACSTSEDGFSPDQHTFKLGVIPGAQDFVVFVMESEGFLQSSNLKPQKLKLLSPNSLHLMIAEKQVDVGFGGITSMANARAQGKDTIVIHGVFSPVNMVFVLKNSPLQSLADLKDHKLGIFGGPGSSTFAFLAVVGGRWHGIDLAREVELVTAPGAALSGLLDNGEIDAALLGTTESIRYYAQQKYRVLVDLAEEYRQHQGSTPAHVTIATNEEFANARPEILKAFLRAYQETVRFIRDHPEVWFEYAKLIGIDSEKEIQVLQEKMGTNLVESWDAQQLDVQLEYLRFAHSVVGDRLLASVPQDLIRNDFNP